MATSIAKTILNNAGKRLCVFTGSGAKKPLVCIEQTNVSDYRYWTITPIDSLPTNEVLENIMNNMTVEVNGVKQTVTVYDGSENPSPTPTGVAVWIDIFLIDNFETKVIRMNIYPSFTSFKICTPVPVDLRQVFM